MSDFERLISNKNAIYILGAGFSAAAGLPLADELWKEVCKRALPMQGRAGKFAEDLDDYIEFKQRSEGVTLTRDQINFEEFLGYLDVEHYLGLRGSDTWSDDGNESQVIIKTLIGQILTERMPRSDLIPSLYIEFAKKLGPYDRVITFNYDTLLERACEAAGKSYRLVPIKYKSASKEGGLVDMSSYDETIILKLHGSIDWFNRKSFRLLQEDARARGYADYMPLDPVFNSNGQYTLTPLHSGPCPENDAMREMYRIDNIERFYSDPPLFLATPKLIAPSTQKIVYANDFHDFWRGKGRDGGHGFRLVIIGYSLPLHDDYARQVIYRLVTNYQDIPSEDIDSRRTKEPLIIVDFCKSPSQQKSLQERYRFIDWGRTQTFFDGFNEDVLTVL